MEIRQLIDMVYKRIWIVLLIPIITASIAAYINIFVMEPEYESSTTVYVNGRNSDSPTPIAYEDILISQYLVKDYRELVKSRSVTKSVLEQLYIANITPGDLAKKITVNLKSETRILEIKVTDSDPVRAKVLTDKVSSVFIDRARSLMKVENIEVVDYAEIPKIPVRPKQLVNIVIAFIVGLLFSIGIVLIIEYMDDTIKTAEDIEKYLELTVLGTIPVSDMK